MGKRQAAGAWAEVSAIICTRHKMLPTNKRGVCAECGHTIYYSELVFDSADLRHIVGGMGHYPADVKKVCEVCAVRLIDGQELERQPHD